MGEEWPWLWRSALGRRWKRGRPFPRAARSFHQPPQLAGSAAAPPAPTELTLFTLDQTGQVYLVSVKKGRLLSPRPPSVNNIGRFCLRAFDFFTSVNKKGLFCLPTFLFASDFPGTGVSIRLVNVWSGAGWCKATCHPRLGGACEGTAMCWKGRRGSPVPPRPATKRISAPPPLNGQERRLRLGRDAGNSTQKVLLPGRPLPVPAQGHLKVHL